MLLVARYDCFVAGKSSESVDYQVRYYDLPESTDLNEMLRKEPVHCYTNEDSEHVEWRFSELVSVEWEPKFEQGEEVIGFITGRPTATQE